MESPEEVATLAPANLEEALDLLWRDPDPDTAGWVLMVERTRFPDHGPHRLSHPRIGLASSAFLEAMRRNESSDAIAELSVLASCSLFEDLPPAGLLAGGGKGGRAGMAAGIDAVEGGRSQRRTGRCGPR